MRRKGRIYRVMSGLLATVKINVLEGREENNVGEPGTARKSMGDIARRAALRVRAGRGLDF